MVSHNTHRAGSDFGLRNLKSVAETPFARHISLTKDGIEDSQRVLFDLSPPGASTLNLKIKVGNVRLSEGPLFLMRQQADRPLAGPIEGA